MREILRSGVPPGRYLLTVKVTFDTPELSTPEYSVGEFVLRER